MYIKILSFEGHFIICKYILMDFYSFRNSQSQHEINFVNLCYWSEGEEFIHVYIYLFILPRNQIIRTDLPVKWQTSLRWRMLDFFNYLVQMLQMCQYKIKDLLLLPFHHNFDGTRMQDLEPWASSTKLFLKNRTLHFHNKTIVNPFC